MQTFAFFFSIFNLNDGRCIQQGAQEREKICSVVVEKCILCLEFGTGSGLLRDLCNFSVLLSCPLLISIGEILLFLARVRRRFP